MVQRYKNVVSGASLLLCGVQVRHVSSEMIRHRRMPTSATAAANIERERQKQTETERERGGDRCEAAAAAMHLRFLSQV